MAEDEIAWLGKWRLDGAKEKDSRGSERCDNDWCVICIPEGGRGRHNGLDKKDADESAYPSKDPDFVLDGNFAEPCEGGDWVVGSFGSRGSIP